MPWLLGPLRRCFGHYQHHCHYEFYSVELHLFLNRLNAACVLSIYSRGVDPLQTLTSSHLKFLGTRKVTRPTYIRRQRTKFSHPGEPVLAICTPLFCSSLISNSYELQRTSHIISEIPLASVYRHPVSKADMLYVLFLAVRLITGCIPNLRGDFVSLVELYLQVLPHYTASYSRWKKPHFEICALLGHYIASSGISVPTLRDNLEVPSSRVKKPYFLTLEDATDKLSGNVGMELSLDAM